MLAGGNKFVRGGTITRSDSYEMVIRKFHGMEIR